MKFCPMKMRKINYCIKKSYCCSVRFCYRRVGQEKKKRSAWFFVAMIPPFPQSSRISTDRARQGPEESNRVRRALRIRVVRAELRLQQGHSTGKLKIPVSAELT